MRLCMRFYTILFYVWVAIMNLLQQPVKNKRDPNATLLADYLSVQLWNTQFPSNSTPFLLTNWLLNRFPMFASSETENARSCSHYPDPNLTHWVQRYFKIVFSFGKLQICKPAMLRSATRCESLFFVSGTATPAAAQNHNTGLKVLSPGVILNWFWLRKQYPKS